MSNRKTPADRAKIISAIAKAFADVAKAIVLILGAAGAVILFKKQHCPA